jgi:WD40 repeat protein
LTTLGEGILPEILYSHDGTKVFLSDGYSVRIMNAANQQEIASFETSEDGYAEIDGLSPDDSLMIIRQIIGFQVIEISTQKEVGRGSGGNGSAVGPVFTRDSKYVVYRSADSTTGGPYHSICLVDLTRTETITTDEEQNCYPTLSNRRYDVMTNPAVSPNGKLVAAGYAESTQNILYIWDLHSQTSLHEIKEQPSRINSVAFSPDGSTLATAGAEGIVRLWNPLTGQVKRSIAAFTNDIEYVAFSPDGRKLIVRVTDQQPVTYDLSTGKTAAFTPEPMDPLSKQMLQNGYLLRGAGSKIRFSPDGKSVAVGHGSLQVWEADTHQLKAALFGEQALAITGMTYSPDGEHLAVTTLDGDVYAWDLRSGRQEFSVAASTLLGGQVWYAAGAGDLGPGIGGGAFGEQGLAFSPDANQIALCNGTAVEIWDLKTAARVLTLAQTRPVKIPTKVSFSKDGKVVYAVLNRNQDVAVWDAQTGELIRRLDLPRVDPNAFSATDLLGIWFARNNYAGAEYWIEIWNLETGQMIKIPTFKREAEPLRFSADGSFFGALFNQQLHIWRTDTGQLAYVSEPGFEVGDFALTTQGSLLATADYGKVTLWDFLPFANRARQPGFSSLPMPPTATPWNAQSEYVYASPTPQPTQVFTPLPVPVMQPGAIRPENVSNLQMRGRLGSGRVHQIQWSPEGERVRVTSSQGVYELDRQTLKMKALFQTDAELVVSSLVLSDDRLLIAGFTPDGKIRVWDATLGEILVELPGTGEPALSPDGKWLVYEVENGLGTWNLENGQPGTVLRSSSLLSWPVFSPNGQFVAAIQSDRSIRVWDVRTGVIVNAAGGPEADITAFSFSPDGKYLLGAGGGTAWVWSLAPSRSPVRVDLFPGVVKDNLTLFADTVTAVSTNKDNSLLAVGTSQKKILLYNRKTAQLLGSLEGLAGSPVKLAFSPDSAWLLSVDVDGQTILWDAAGRKAILKTHAFGGEIAGLVARLDGDVSAWMNNTVQTFASQDASLKQTTYLSTGKILAASPAGDLVAGYDPLKVSLYAARTGELVQTLPEEAEDVWVEYYWEGDILRQFYGALFSPDGKRLATFGAGGIWIYSSPEGKLISHLEGNNTRKAAFSPDGNWLVASTFENTDAPALIDFGTGKGIFDFVFPYNEDTYAAGRVYAQYAVSPDKRWVALLRRGGGGPPRLELVDASTGLLARALEFKDTGLFCLAFNPSGSLLAVGQADGTVALVDVATLKVLTAIKAHFVPVTALVFSRDGTRLVTGGEDGVVKVWGLP